MDFWKSLSGMITVEFTGADPEKTLDTITLAHIPVAYVIMKEALTFRILIHRADYSQLTRIFHQRGDHYAIVRRSGFYWDLKAFLHRPVLSFLFLLFLLLSFLLPTRILFISVAGNEGIPGRLILSAAEECGIRFGSPRKQVRSEKVKNALLASVPQLQWAGVNTSGCTAVISVRERIEKEPAPEKNIVSNIIAERDGYILSSTVTAGTAHFKTGDTVTKGQLLVSGYTDCGICIRASRAEGEIFAQTNRKMTAIMPAAYRHPVGIQKEKYRISFLLGKKRINLWKDSRISDTGCGRMYEEYYFSLPGGFRLPIAICVDRYWIYELQEREVSEYDAQHRLQQFLKNYLLKQMVAGQILEARHHLSCVSGNWKLEGEYLCTEMIGNEQREQNGVINGKRN